MHSKSEYEIYMFVRSFFLFSSMHGSNKHAEQQPFDALLSTL